MPKPKITNRDLQDGLREVAAYTALVERRTRRAYWALVAAGAVYVVHLVAYWVV